jgi:NADH-quinone oxidoreductase subunit J
MDINSLVFYLFSGLAIGFALNVILQKNPVSSAFSLVMVFFAFAGIYACLQAHLIAAIQILVYAGAIMVLFVFVIMLLNEDTPSVDLIKGSKTLRILSISVSVVFAFSLIYMFKNATPTQASGPFTVTAIQEGGGNTRVISQLMFSEYLLPFELTSVLLLTAVIGAVAIAKRKQGGKTQ